MTVPGKPLADLYNVPRTPAMTCYSYRCAKCCFCVRCSYISDRQFYPITPCFLTGLAVNASDPVLRCGMRGLLASIASTARSAASIVSVIIVHGHDHHSTDHHDGGYRFPLTRNDGHFHRFERGGIICNGNARVEGGHRDASHTIFGLLAGKLFIASKKIF